MSENGERKRTIVAARLAPGSGIGSKLALPRAARWPFTARGNVFNMSTSTNPASVFDALKLLMLPYARKLVCKTDEPGNLYVDTDHVMKNGRPLFFGAIQTRKTYVSYHLMPIYVNPGLLDGISEALQKRMQGKSCFNFKKVDADLIFELGRLTQSGYDYYVDEGYIQP